MTKAPKVIGPDVRNTDSVSAAGKNTGLAKISRAWWKARYARIIQCLYIDCSMSNPRKREQINSSVILGKKIAKFEYTKDGDYYTITLENGYEFSFKFMGDIDH